MIWRIFGWGLLLLASHSLALTGMVRDSRTGQPIAGAIVTSATAVVKTDSHGRFNLVRPGLLVLARAPGYLRFSVRAPAQAAQPLDIVLMPFRPKALYLSYYGISSRTLRDAALNLINSTELNALVIDVKGDRGRIPYRSEVPLRAGLGRQPTVLINDMPALIQTLKQQKVYLIARIVSFKDDPLARSKPDLAVKQADGAIWHDREGLAWVDPFQPEVWRYNLDIAEEAAKLGFDEIQFDYVRFPDAAGLQFSRANTQASRVEAITGFLHAARARLAPYNVFVAADIFGYVCWNLNDTAIGQQLERLGEPLDYLSPMLYPSGFTWGIPSYPNAAAAPYEIVYDTLQRALLRTKLPGVRFRPWLQAFRDYAFDHRVFGAEQIRAQIDAAEKLGSDGWMLWNPLNRYSRAGLAAKPRQGAVP